MARTVCWVCGVIMMAVLSGCGGSSNNNGGGPGTPAATPTFSPAAGTYSSAQNIALADSTSGAAIYYTLDGSNPTTASALYKTPIAVSTTLTIRALATAAGLTTSSTGSAAYTIVAPLAIATTAAQVPGGTLNSPYAGVTLTAMGGVAPYSWSVSTGSLPAGLLLNSNTGAISGTPSEAGISNFTIKVADAEPTPQTATLQASITIAVGPLTVTTSALPSATDGVAYQQTLTLSGGLPPFTWSVSESSTLPAGIALATTSGVLAGTPAGVSSTIVAITVTDAAMHTASASLMLVVNPGPGTMPAGPYSFLFSGTSPAGPVALAGTFTIAGTISPYTVTSGEFDRNFNTNTDTAASAKPTTITGGTLFNGTDGLGTLTLMTASGSMTFALAVPKSIATPGSDSAVRMIEFDDASGMGTRGSGLMKVAQAKPVLPPAGSYAFLVSGTGNGSAGDQPQHSLAGSFQTDAQGNIASGVADAFGGGTGVDQPYTNLVSSNPISVDAQGRGSLSMVLQSGSVANFAFYQVSPGDWFTLTLDPPSSSVLSAGEVLAQNVVATPAGNPLPFLAAFYSNGLTAPGLVPDVTAGLAFNTGGVSLGYDEYNGLRNNGATNDLPVLVDFGTGRAVIATPTILDIFYLIDSNRAFFSGTVGESNTSSSVGFLEVQTETGLTNAALSGSYAGGSLFLDNTAVLNESGTITADGNGNIQFTTNRSSKNGLVQYKNVTGTYAQVGDNGRMEVTLPDGVARVIYTVSPTKIIYLSDEAGGYVGVFQQ